MFSCRRDHPFATRKGHNVFGLIANLSPLESTISILGSLDETQLELDLRVVWMITLNPLLLQRGSITLQRAVESNSLARIWMSILKTH